MGVTSFLTQIYLGALGPNTTPSYFNQRLYVYVLKETLHHYGPLTAVRLPGLPCLPLGGCWFGERSLSQLPTVIHSTSPGLCSTELIASQPSRPGSPHVQYRGEDFYLYLRKVVMCARHKLPFPLLPRQGR